MRKAVLYEAGGHANIELTELGDRPRVESNQFIIVDGREGMVLDPGGPKSYPNVLVSVRSALSGGDVRHVFMSHQDPDVVTSLNAWLVDTRAEILISRLWERFVHHFGIDQLLARRLVPIPDEGMRVRLGAAELVLLPAHFLHSPGNFQVYDPISKTLFSGDLGASEGAPYAAVEDFDAHVRYAAPFHRRYMASRSTVRAWAKMVRSLDIEVIAPQHGAIYRGRPMVERFLRWSEDEPCGVDLMGDSYLVPGA